jgi:hypothetical protein
MSERGRRLELCHEWGNGTDSTSFESWLMDKVVALEGQLQRHKREVTNDACGDALDKLWKEIILLRMPNYGDWEYPGQAYRHLKAEFDAIAKHVEILRARDGDAEYIIGQYQEKLRRIKRVACGEEQIDDAVDDTDALNWIYFFSKEATDPAVSPSGEKAKCQIAPNQTADDAAAREKASGAGAVSPLSGEHRNAYICPAGVKPVPPGGVEPNSGLPCWSGVIGKIIALHRFDSGGLWVMFQNHDGNWVTLRRATTDDQDHFVAAGAAIRT